MYKLSQDDLKAIFSTLDKLIENKRNQIVNLSVEGSRSMSLEDYIDSSIRLGRELKALLFVYNEVMSSLQNPENEPREVSTSDLIPFLETHFYCNTFSNCSGLI